MPVDEVKDIYDEWASGVSLANNSSSNYFEEIPTELNTPSTFTVTPEQLPTDPTTHNEPLNIPEPPSGVTDEPEVLDVSGGGTLTIEKTNKGWKAILESGEANIPSENFYGDTIKKLALNIAKGKLEASRLIRKLKKEKLIGGDEPTRTVVPSTPRNVATIKTLTADEEYEIKNALTENPSLGMDAWVKKRFGLNPDEFAEALKSAPEAKRIIEAQKIKNEVESVNVEFVRQNPDYLEFVNTDDDDINHANIRLLIGRMAKAYLNKKITKSTSQVMVDDTIADLFDKGYWTVETLEKAKEELVENGLFERPAPNRISTPQPQQVAAPSGPSEPVASRIAAAPGQPVGFGLPARSSSPAAIPESQPLSDVDLQKLPMDQLKAIAMAQLKAQMQGRQ